MTTNETAPPRAPAEALGATAFALTARHGLAEMRPRLAAKLGIPAAELPMECALLSQVVDELIGRLPELAPVSRTEPGAQLKQFLETVGNSLARGTDVNLVVEELVHHAARDPIVARLVEPLETAWHVWLVDLIDAAIATGELRANLDPVATAWWIMATIHGLRLMPLSGREHADEVLALLASDFQSPPWNSQESHSR
jgi:hypothetical protein